MIRLPHNGSIVLRHNPALLVETLFVDRDFHNFKVHLLVKELWIVHWYVLLLRYVLFVALGLELLTYLLKRLEWSILSVVN